MESYIEYIKLQDKAIPELLDELSFIARETTGGSFVIQHCKEDGQWKVVFTNAMAMVKNDGKLKYTDFRQALINGIIWIRSRRKLVEVPIERYTIY